MQEIRRYLKRLSNSMNILYVGTFLSRKTGTKDVAEVLRDNIELYGFKINLVSKYENKLLRLMDIGRNILLYTGDTIIFNVFSGLAFKITEYGSFLAKLRSKKIIFILHGGALPEYTRKNAERVKKVFSRADYIQTPSLFLNEFFCNRGYDVKYLPNSINIENFKYSRIEVSTCSILWVRAFTEIYNPQIAIDVLKSVKSIFPLATLTMVGPDKGLLEVIKQKTAELGLEDSVKFIGPVPNEELYKYYQSHAVYLNTTSFESFGMAVVEAAACGIPIVSTSVGELPYLWTHKKDIMLVNSFNPNEFSTAIEEIFNDPKMAERLSLNARKNIEKFQWENIRPQWIKLLETDGLK